MLGPSLMASTILFTTATRGGDEGAFDPGIERGDLADKPASLGFEGAIGGLHIRIVLLRYGNVKKKNRAFVKALIRIASKSYKSILCPRRYPPIPSYPT